MTIGLPALSPSNSAPLPALYQQAKAALAECKRIDEVKEYADKAAALAAYAALQNDEELENLAKRIRGRAAIRVGELLQQIDPSKGGRPPETGEPRHPSLRKAAAEAAGLSEHQAKTAIRAANAPEALKVRLDDDHVAPPSVKELARAGRKPSSSLPSRHIKKPARKARKKQSAQGEWAGWGRLAFVGADLWRLGDDLSHGEGGSLKAFISNIRALDPKTKAAVLLSLDFLGRADAALKHLNEYPPTAFDRHCPAPAGADRAAR